MSFRSLITLAALAALAASVKSHIIMESPVPYSVDKIDNSPITAMQFPCKSQNGFTVSKMNNMAVGQQQTIKFKGTAVHGGGSCQLSVTMDTNPTADSVFKVIKSIEGGCPGVDGTTNEYNFALPSSIPNGKATFAWTWFSKMSGAPELYMNCAPIEVTGGASDKTAFNALPDMLVANIGKGCTTAQNFATKFPNPGSEVQEGATNDQKPPTGSCGSASGTTPAQPSAGQPSTPQQSSAAPKPSVPAGQPSTPASKPVTAPSAAPSAPGGVFAPGASSATGAPAQTSTTLVTVTAAPTPAKPTQPASPGTGVPAAPAPAQPSGSAPSPGGAAGSTCTTNGAVVCNGQKQFGLCNNGNVVWQDVAAGTVCSNGVISKRGYNGRIARPRMADTY